MRKKTGKLNKTAILNWFLSLQFIFRPNWWIMGKPYSKEVDSIILELLEKHEFKNICITKCTAELGNAIIWIENRPYSCIWLYETSLEGYRPSRLTILKALKKLEKLEEIERKKEIIEFYNQASAIRRYLGLN